MTIASHYNEGQALLTEGTGQVPWNNMYSLNSGWIGDSCKNMKRRLGNRKTNRKRIGYPLCQMLRIFWHYRGKMGKREDGGSGGRTHAHSSSPILWPQSPSCMTQGTHKLGLALTVEEGQEKGIKPQPKSEGSFYLRNSVHWTKGSQLQKRAKHAGTMAHANLRGRERQTYKPWGQESAPCT